MPKVVSDEKLLEALLIHGNISKASRELGISKSAIYKRLKNDDFREQFDRLQGITLTVVSNSLSDSLNDAVEVLRSVLLDPDVSPSTKVQASDVLLRHCSRYIETSTILRRIEKLEENESKEGEIYNAS